MTKRKDKTMSEVNELDLGATDTIETVETVETVTTEVTEAPQPETNDDGSAVDDSAETPAHLKNDKRMTDFLNATHKLGQETALGQDALPKLAHHIVKAAADGVIDSTFKNKQGSDAADLIYAKYLAGISKKAMHEHSAAGKAANVSKLRQLIKLGELNNIDPTGLMQDAFEVREELSKMSDGPKLKPAYPFYVELARAQMAQPNQQFSREQLSEMAPKDTSEKEPKTLDQKLSQIEKLLEALVSGENRDKVKDQSDLTEAAYNAVKERRGQLMKMAMVAKLRADAAKLGIVLA